MGLVVSESLSRFLFAVCIFCFVMAGLANANVVLIGRNVSLSFDDLEASFALPINESGECGTLYVSQPLDACSSLTNKIADDSNSRFVLIVRGGCTFDAKVRNAQDAGFNATIIYDDEDRSTLVSMAGNPVGIHIHAVFVYKAAGETLKKYAGRNDVELWIVPTYRSSLLSIMVISFICLLAVSVMVGTCFFVRRHLIRRERPRAPNIQQFHGMSSKLVKLMPSVTFTSVSGDSCTSATCAICLEDYAVGDNLRILPCSHKFHASCVDSWLTTWRTFCPVCKRDARIGVSTLPASESTPLLSSRAGSFCLDAALPHHSPVAVAPAQLQSNSRPDSPSSSPVHFVNRSYAQSLAISIHKSFIDLRNSSHLSSFHSHHNSSINLGCLSSSPINVTYASPQISSSTGASSSFAASSSRQTFLRHNSESASLSFPSSGSSLPC